MKKAYLVDVSIMTRVVAESEEDAMHLAIDKTKNTLIDSIDFSNIAEIKEDNVMLYDPETDEPTPAQPILFHRADKEAPLAIIKIDFELLRKQKAQLFEMVNSETINTTPEQHLAIEGILSLLDGVMDATVDQGIFTEKEVFGPHENENHAFCHPELKSDFGAGMFTGRAYRTSVDRMTSCYILSITEDKPLKEAEIYSYDTKVLAERDESTFHAKIEEEPPRTQKTLHPIFPEHIAGIVGRKQNGIDCTEEESAEIKGYIQEIALETDQINIDNLAYLEKEFPAECEESINDLNTHLSTLQSEQQQRDMDKSGQYWDELTPAQRVQRLKEWGIYYVLIPVNSKWKNLGPNTQMDWHRKASDF